MLPVPVCKSGLNFSPRPFNGPPPLGSEITCSAPLEIPYVITYLRCKPGAANRLSATPELRYFQDSRIRATGRIPANPIQDGVPNSASTCDLDSQEGVASANSCNATAC